MDSFNIAGFFILDLKGIDQLQPEKTADTIFTQKVRSFLESLGTGNYDRSLVTESFIGRINPITKLIFNPSAIPDLSFVGSDKLANKHLQRYGIEVKQINYY